MGIALLGPLEVDGQPGLPPRDRVVLEALAIHDHAAVSAEVLADALWGEDPPASWPKIVQGSVWRLRRALGHSAIETTTAGYRLTVGDDELDLRLFQRLVAQGRSLTASHQPDRAAATFAKALALWRGEPLPDLDQWPAGRYESVRLEELRRSVQEEHVRALLDAGEDVVPSASALVSSDPLREARWALLARALYCTGRQSEALTALRTARSTLQEELALDPGHELIELEHAILTHDPGLRVVSPGPARDLGRCPYKGLLAYEEADAPLFFGRGHEVERCLSELRHHGLLVLAGPSGGGKSSLARAGLGPALASAGRRVAVTTPGTDPESALLVAAAAPRSTVLVVDQLEELFTAGHSDALAREVLDRLEQEDSSGRDVILVVRGDHLGSLAVSASMAHRVEQGLHLLAPMTQDGLRAAVEGPAEQAGLVLEPGLVELLLAEVENEPGALPLLSHALAETWERREGNGLTVDGYRATGGIRGAVAKSAESLYQSLPADRRTAMRAVMMRLVAVSPDGEPVMTRVPLAKLSTDREHRATLDLLRQARLVTSDETTATLAHEAVVRAWPRLRTWLDEDAAGQGILRHLSQAAEDWATRGRPDSELYRGVRLESALEWRGTRNPTLTDVETEFLKAAERLRAAEQEDAADRLRYRVRQASRLRVALVGTAGGLVLAVVAGGLAVTQQREATDTAARADVERLVAQSTTLRDTRRDLAALLAVEAHRRMPGALTRDALLGVFTAAPGFAGYQPTEAPLTTGQVLPDGQTMLAMGTDGVVRLVDIRTGQTTFRLPAPPKAATGGRVAVSADARTAAAISWTGHDRGGGDAWLTVFDITSRTRLHRDVPLPLDPGAVAVSPDGRFVAVSGYEDGRVLVFDTRSDIPELSTVDDVAAGVRSLPVLGSAALPFAGKRRTAGLAFTSDGTLVVGSEVGVVRLVDPASGQARRLTGGPDLSSNNLVAASPDGNALVTAGTEAVVRWDLASGRPRWTTALREETCQSLLVLPEANSVLCGGRFARVVSLDLRTGAETSTTQDMQRGTVSDLLLTPDRSTLVQLSSSQPVIARWRLDGAGPLARLLHVPGAPAAYNADGSMLLVAGPVTATDRWGQPIQDWRVVDSRDGRTLTMLYADEHVPSWTKKPHELLVWPENRNGRAIDVRDHRQTMRLNGGLGRRPTGVSISGDGRRLLAWDADSILIQWEVWDLRTGEPEAAGRVRDKQAASLSRTGRYIVWTQGDAVSTSVSAKQATVAERPGVVHAAVSPTGLVAASHIDGKLAFLRARDLTPVGPAISQPIGHVRLFSFSTDGNLLAAHSGDGGVRLIDVASRRQLGEPWDLGRLHTRSVALRPDGKELALPHLDGVLLWDLRTSSAVREACRLAGRTLTEQEARTFLGGSAPVGCS